MKVPTGHQIGRAGEFAVATELLRRGVDVAIPAIDNGVDLIAYRERDPSIIIPIQIKSASAENYAFKKMWLSGNDKMVLVHVWHLGVTDALPVFYLFDGLASMDQALHRHVETQAWMEHGVWNAPNGVPSGPDHAAIEPFRDRWDFILGKLPSETLR